MALNFEGTSAILNLAPGGVTLPGALSVAVLCRMNDDTERAGIVSAYTAANGVVWNWARRGSAEGTDPNLLMYGNAVANSRAVAFNVADGWCVVGFNKATGTTAPRFHKVTLAGVATHGASATTVANASGTVSKIVVGAWGDGDTTQFSAMDIAVVGMWNSSLSDANFASLYTGIAAWTALSPDALDRFESMVAVTATVGTSTESSRTGTTLVDSPEPFLLRRIQPRNIGGAVRRAAFY